MPLPRDLVPEPLCQHLAEKGNPCQMLPQAVVQIVSDALPFALADLYELTLSLAALGHIGRDGEGTGGAVQLDPFNG